MRSASEPSVSDPQLRLRSLDGLRGVAAGIVLLHHLSMTIPAVSNGYDSASDLDVFAPAWWLVATPLKVFVAGPEFVLVFFVLSGFVLALAPLKSWSGADARTPLSGRPGFGRRRSAYDWFAYYPRRVLRLGVPVVASMVLAYFVITLFPHPSKGSDGSWLTRQAHPDTSFHNLWTETLLIVDPNHPSVNPPLWSLTWEMWFSLLLPLVVLIALFSRRVPVLWGLLFIAISVYGYLANIEAAMFLPAFALGALLGANADRIRALVDRWQGSRALTFVFAAILVGGPLLSICYWFVRPLFGTAGDDVAMAMRVPGALLLVAAVAFWPAAGRIFAARPFATLGKVSFSLYLVHSPIVVLFGLNFTGSEWPLGAGLAIGTSFALAILMYVLVERPSRHLAGWAGRRVSAAVGAVTRPIAVAAELDEHRTRLARERVLVS
ncbi:acyltransferase family protein [Humibacter ginsengiterrae]